jgi:N-acetylated-alpha-linked acidic dipeptidase
MAEAKAIGALAKAGWKPKRTLVYTSWDGEEPGLLGSTEFAEAHADELRHKAVLYVNYDTNGRGVLFADGSHSFQHFVNEVTGSVLDPETGASIHDRLRASLRVEPAGKDATSDDRAMGAAADIGGDLPLGALGGGSDYSAFLQHLGISTINLGFGGEDVEGGIYHSTYDSFDHFIRFGDPKFTYEVALAQTAGRLVLRTADADVLPMRFADLAGTAARYVDEVEKLCDAERESARKLQRLIDDGAFKLAADPENPVAAPASPDDVPFFDFTVLDAAAARLKKSADAYDTAFAEATASDFRLPAGEIKQLNTLLQGVEQTLTNRAGLPGREWYQHMLYAPGQFTGYAAKTLPALRESIELRHWSSAIDYIPVVAAVLNTAATRLDQATLQLKPRLGPVHAQDKPKGPPPPPPDN